MTNQPEIPSSYQRGPHTAVSRRFAATTTTTTTRKPNQKSKSPRWRQAIQGWCHTAKQIYDIGPQGEGQKAWRAIQQARREKQSHVKATQAKPPPSALVHAERCNKPHSYSSTKPSPFGLASTSSSSSPSRFYSGPETLPSHDTHPIHLNKPLPPIPLRNSKPPPSSSPRPLSPLTPPPPPRHSPTKNPWWRILAPTHQPATPPPPSLLKAKISRPRPISIPYYALTHGVPVSELASVRQAPPLPSPPLPAPLLPPPRSYAMPMPTPTPTQTATPLIETPPTYWLERFEAPAFTLGKSWQGMHTSQRRDSDVSFACRGL